MINNEGLEEFNAQLPDGLIAERTFEKQLEKDKDESFELFFRSKQQIKVLSKGYPERQMATFYLDYDVKEYLETYKQKVREAIIKIIPCITSDDDLEDYEQHIKWCQNCKLLKELDI